MASGARPAPLLAFRDGRLATEERQIPEETAIALVYDGVTQAVMMATPADLEDFALGFTLTEGIIAGAGEIREIAVRLEADGIALCVTLSARRAFDHARRRRLLTGPTGCGLCGVDSLAAAVRPLCRVADGLTVDPGEIIAALAALGPAQTLNHRTRAVHGAGFWVPGQGLAALREDVGRHNALDKLVGALSRAGIAGAAGVVLLTSRVSVEMVQKTVLLGAPILVAVSAPTSLAVATAERAGLTLVAVARDTEFEVFTHPRRITAPDGTAPHRVP